MSDSETKAGDELALAVPDPSAPPEAAARILDCWNTIGVEGDGSCAQLREVIHCRNCPVYSNAGLQLLERALPPGYRRECTDYFRLQRKPARGSKISVVIFRVGPEWLALPTQAFQEVAEPRPVHSIPHRRHGLLLGLVNIRGELLLCVSVGRLLGVDHNTALEKLRTYHDRLLVVAWDGKRLVFPADEVHGIHHFHAGEAAPPPPASAKAGFTQGVFSWQEKLVGWLEPQLLFSALSRSFV
jgi:chemotaxis-related protein WspD